MCGILGLVEAEVTPTDSASISQDGTRRDSAYEGEPVFNYLAELAADGLIALQHRGTESAGLVGSNGDPCTQHLEIVKGAINCVQPFVVYTVCGPVAIAHNGELVDVRMKRKELLESGVGLSTDTDSELIAQMVAKAIALNINCHLGSDEKRSDIAMELAVTMSALNISYSLLVLTADRLYAIRDPFGNRPLCVGTVYKKTTDGTRVPLAYMASSESCALPANAVLSSEVKPGEIICLSKKGMRSICQMKPQTRQAFCIFEYVYFARADSILEGQQVHAVREECGRMLAKEGAVEADLVCTVPDSGMAATVGYAQESGIRFSQALYRNSYDGRSFIQPNTRERQVAITRKFGVLTSNVRGKRIVLIDDSIVRGNTMSIIVSILKEAGAKEVHLRIASPPVRHPCYMGINIPSQSELVAANRTIEEITQKIGADSVVYLSVEGLLNAVQKAARTIPGVKAGHCTACLTGEYPVDIEDY